MPHFGLVDENKLGPIQSLLMRARLHIRGGKIRLQEKDISLGIITLYDALCTALNWYILVPDNVERLGIDSAVLIRDEKSILSFLEKVGVLDGSFAFDEFDKLVERAILEEIEELDDRSFISDIEKVMTSLDVMPFDESLLPDIESDTI